MKPGVFIQTNRNQHVGAVIAAHALRRNSRRGDAFDVTIMHSDDYPFLAARDGQPFLRDGGKWVWNYHELQSFTPLRFLPPELMGYEGRAVVIDPDIFAVGDIWELLSRDMEGRAIFCRPRLWEDGSLRYLASSVMLLDCARLRHWKTEETFAKLFSFEVDYMKWINLELEPLETVGYLEPEWNHFDELTDETRLVHNTKRKTQPWKTGLPVDFSPTNEAWYDAPRHWWRQTLNVLRGRPPRGRYKPHPDKRQEDLVFGLLKEVLESGQFSEAQLREEMRRNNVRHDAFEVMDRAPRLAA